MLFALTLASATGVDAARAGDPARILVTRDAAAAACPDERALRDAVAARLGYDPFADTAPRAVVVTFVKDGRGLRGTVQLRDTQGRAKGERTFTSTGRGCEELASTATLTISILLDPRAGLGPPATPPATSTTPAPTTPTTPPTAEPAAPSDDPFSVPAAPVRIEPPSEPVRMRVTAAGGVALGVAPVPALAVLVGVGIERRWWILGAQLRIDAPASDATGGLAARTRYTAGTFMACGRLSVAYACGVATLGALAGEILGAPPSRQSTFHALLGPRLGVELPIAHVLSFDAYVEGTYALTSTVLRAGASDVWSTPSLAALGAIGVVGRFP